MALYSLAAIALLSSAALIFPLLLLFKQSKNFRFRPTAQVGVKALNQGFNMLSEETVLLGI